MSKLTVDEVMDTLAIGRVMIGALELEPNIVPNILPGVVEQYTDAIEEEMLRSMNAEESEMSNKLCELCEDLALYVTPFVNAKYEQ